MTTIPILSFDQVTDRLIALSKPWHSDFFSMYSSWYGGIITDPALMMVPVDDHLVHRGDGVFEAFKCTNWNIYGLERHLDRMERSARVSYLNLPADRSAITKIVKASILAGGHPECVIRLFVSRGPGGFSANPYESPESQLYVVVMRLTLPPESAWGKGVSLMTSSIPVKRDYFANIKSCNYLPNVLMVKEAIDANAQFAVSIDDHGFLGEGATENLGIITAEREFLVPRFERVLRGTTVSRMLELAGPLVSKGELTSIAEADITREQAYSASEIMMFGTSFNVLPVVSYDGHLIGDGKPGPVYSRFSELLREDTLSGPGMLTPVKGNSDG